MIAVEDIRKMTLAERIEAINLIWSTLDEFPDEEIESPAWHADVLAERTRRMEAGEETFYTLDEAWQKLEEFKALHRK